MTDKFVLDQLRDLLKLREKLRLDLERSRKRTKELRDELEANRIDVENTEVDLVNRQQRLPLRDADEPQPAAKQKQKVDSMPSAGERPAAAPLPTRQIVLQNVGQLPPQPTAADRQPIRQRENITL